MDHGLRQATLSLMLLGDSARCSAPSFDGVFLRKTGRRQYRLGSARERHDDRGGPHANRRFFQTDRIPARQRRRLGWRRPHQGPPGRRCRSPPRCAHVSFTSAESRNGAVATGMGDPSTAKARIRPRYFRRSAVQVPRHSRPRRAMG